MTATVAPSAAPSHAVKVWSDDLNIYAEVPSLNQPCVMAFPICEAGLSRVLTVLGAQRLKEGSGEPYLRPPVIAAKLMKDGITQKDLDAAAQVLRDMGIIK
jgi:hypothetical protein